MSAVAVLHHRPTVAAPRAEATAALPVATGGRGTLLYFLVILAATFAAVFGAVALNAMAAQASVEARALERSVADGERKYGELIAAVAAKEDPSRIRERALELGLVPAPAARHILLARAIDADGARAATVDRSAVPDPLKPVLTQDR
jgi:hypothetical protein